MVKQREGHKVIFSDLAKQRIKDNCCPTCGKPKDKWTRRKDWRCCSTECTERFWKEQVIVKSWQDLREKCFERDGWRCAKCGKQPTTLIRKGYESYYHKVLKVEYLEKWGGNMATIVDTLIADHIQAIALGGDEWDINNIQTLCPECNKIKTKEDAGKIAKLRDIEKKQSNGQTLLPLAVKQKVDGFPPTLKSVGIQPKIL